MGFVDAVQRLLFGVGDLFEKAVHVAGGEIARAAFVVKEDEAARPVGEAIALAVRTEVLPGDVAKEIEQARRVSPVTSWREEKCTREQRPW